MAEALESRLVVSVIAGKPPLTLSDRVSLMLRCPKLEEHLINVQFSKEFWIQRV